MHLGSVWFQEDGATAHTAQASMTVLSGDEKHARVEHCKDMLRSAQSDIRFIKSIVTGDQTWCFQYEPLTKRHSAAYAKESSKDTGDRFLRFQRNHSQGISARR
ncbi:hypothetical protein B7P43_G09051 [Cryptotermes secundus]|uniref:Mariner Mos1 transposase n=1 Tax=Cryptotermes secundus TaxID=105785 RepID=A0A2J7PHM8_9NEOP|nr:hypothetical protein B7P43_G09051 [Cryptotermes secundus]